MTAAAAELLKAHLRLDLQLHVAVYRERRDVILAPDGNKAGEGAAAEERTEDSQGSGLSFEHIQKDYYNKYIFVYIYCCIYHILVYRSVFPKTSTDRRHERNIMEEQQSTAQVQRS